MIGLITPGITPISLRHLPYQILLLPGHTMINPTIISPILIAPSTISHDDDHFPMLV